MQQQQRQALLNRSQQMGSYIASIQGRPPQAAGGGTASALSWSTATAEKDAPGDTGGAAGPAAQEDAGSAEGGDSG